MDLMCIFGICILTSNENEALFREMDIFKVFELDDNDMVHNRVIPCNKKVIHSQFSTLSSRTSRSRGYMHYKVLEGESNFLIKHNIRFINSTNARNA